MEENISSINLDRLEARLGPEIFDIVHPKTGKPIIPGVKYDQFGEPLVDQSRISYRHVDIYNGIN